MSTLDVPTAKLDYQIIGEGPLMVLIAGARGSGAIYQPLAQHLASRFRVLTYDRRGYANSTLDGAQDYSRRLETDADDVARLIRHLDAGPAIVFGSSSGAIVALEVLIRHPEAVSILIAHEPPAVTLVPDSEKWVASFHELYNTYRTEGLQPAMGKFLTSMMSESDRKTLSQSAGRGDPAQMARDFDYWFEHELRQYPPTKFDMVVLKAAADRLVFITGQDTPDLLPHRIAVLFAQRLGTPLHALPGGHVGYVTYADEFARELTGLLGERGSIQGTPAG